MRLLVPYQAVSQPSIKELVIHQPERCSHCDAVPAPRTETHAVVIKTDAIPHRQIGKKYRNQIRLLVRLPLCETCYYKKYLTSSDTYTRDDTPLGAQSRQHEKLANTGGILAGLAILLLTPFIPASGFLVVLKTYWYVLLILGVVCWWLPGECKRFRNPGCGANWMNCMAIQSSTPGQMSGLSRSLEYPIRQRLP